MASRRDSCTWADNCRQPQPPKTAPVYVKKDTWHESMRASLEATFGPTDGTDRAAGTQRVPAGDRPAHGRRATGAAGVSRRRAGAAVLRHARPPAGKRVGALPQPAAVRQAGQFRRPGTRRPDGGRQSRRPCGPDDGVEDRRHDASRLRARARRSRLQARRQVRAFGSVRLLPAGDGLPPHAAVDCRPIFARASECRQVRESLWDQVARDFRDRQSQIEMELERRDGIWNEYLADRERGPQCVLSRACPTATGVGPQDARIRGTNRSPGRELAAELKTLAAAHRPSRQGPGCCGRTETSLPRRSTSGAGSSSRTPRSISTGCW